MAMETSVPSSNVVSEDPSSAQGVEDVSQEGNTAETTESKLSADPAENAENAKTQENIPPQDTVDYNSYDSKKALDTEKEDNAVEDDTLSVESFDSALERIAVASTGEPASPEAPSSPTFEPAEGPQQIALRQLNFWKTGVSSLDSSILDNLSATEFKNRVVEIAQLYGLSADSEDVESVISALLPVVEENIDNVLDKEVVNSMVISSGSTEDNVNDDGNTQDVKQEVSSLHVDTNVDDVIEKNDVTDRQGMEIPDGDDEEKDSVAQGKNSSITGDALIEDGVPADSLDAKKFAEDESIVDSNNDDISEENLIKDDLANGPASKVIEGEKSSGSDVDDVSNLKADSSPSEAKESKDIGDSGSVDAAAVQQESGIHDGQKELVDKGTRLDDETKKECTRLDDSVQAEVSGEKVPIDVNASAQLDLNESDNAPPILKTTEELSPENELKDVQNTSEELDGVEEKEELPASAVKSDDPASTAEILENDSVQTQVAGATTVSEDSTAGDEFSAAQAREMNDTEENSHLTTRAEVFGSKDTLNGSVKVEEPVTAISTSMPSIEEGVANEEAGSESKKEQESEDLPAPTGARTETASSDASSSLGGAGPSLPVRPAGLGRSVPSLDHATRAIPRSSGSSASARQPTTIDEENSSNTDVSEGNDDAREKLQMIRVKFLRLAHRLGQSAHNVVVAQVLYRLGLAEQLRGGRGTGRAGTFSFERASSLAEEQEAAGIDDLEFGCTIMVLGKSGVGKSATINSLFDEIKSGTNAYSPATTKVQEIVGTVHGIRLRVIDTPGLLTSFADQRRNERIMASVKRFIKKSPPDIVLYFDRLDMQSRDYGDLPLLRTITDTFGSAVWFNAIVVLTHASSAPPDGANGAPVSYEMFVAQRSHVVQQTIRQAAGDMRLMNPVSLVENHTACRRNRSGERVLPNGQVWKPQLLLLCFASKILAEANSLLKLQDSTPARPFGVRSRVPPLPFLLSSLLQSRAQLKLPDEQIGSEDDDTEDESDEDADSETEEYDDLPPFRRLTKAELKLLDKEQRKAYAEELEYREKLFMKKQLKDDRARKKEMKRRLASLPKDVAEYPEESFEEENASASVPVPMPDMALPPSFDSDNPTYRYRYLDAANQWLVRPVLETHGWDHDSGYDGLNVEKMFVVSKKIPVSISGQVTKDKKEANLQMECAASFKNGEGRVTQAGLDVQTIGKDLAYTLRSETRFDNFRRNKTTCGLAVTLLGDTIAAGMKLEDRLLIGKRVKLVFNGGALTGRGDVAYGGSLEATLKDEDYPLGPFLSTFGLSVMDWHGDLAIGGNLQVQFKVGRTMTVVRGNLNNRRAGQVSVRFSSSEQLQMALIGLIPLLRTFINNKILNSN
ncbi:hypothetical protein KP509_01G052900 [Ceratopteris richardii]|uniref:AIG1-type G domain-containing protein n=1 Tax=Ceratopteris richardii TaxID=49495 RepID=A0A8T2VJS5_CERRI|nr:hypothetical protein KP509_01G052900 [Ceratopteris richardii]